MLTPENALVPIEALAFRKNIAEQIISQEADYLFAVKRNQKEPYNELALVFGAYDAQMFPWVVCEQESLGKWHGRLEKRMSLVVSDMDNLDAESNWLAPSCSGRVYPSRREGKNRLQNKIVH